jgi:hypothetical protein
MHEATDNTKYTHVNTHTYTHMHIHIHMETLHICTYMKHTKKHTMFFSFANIPTINLSAAGD